MITFSSTGVNTTAKSALSSFGSLAVNFVAPLIFLGLFMALGIGYTLPSYKALPDLKETLSQGSSEVIALEAKIKQLTLLNDNKGLVIADLVKMSWAFEERDKVPELSEQVRRMSTDSGVTFSSLDYVNQNKSETPTAVVQTQPALTLNPDPELYREEKVAVTISLKNLPSLVQFLKTAETSIRLFKVQGIAVSLESGGYDVSFAMASPYLNPSFSTYSETAAPIDLTNTSYREFMQRLDSFKNYAKDIDSTLPKI